jgi:hypothetical protein
MHAVYAAVGPHQQSPEIVGRVCGGRTSIFAEADLGSLEAELGEYLVRGNQIAL